MLDLLIIGAGPAGLSCALAANEADLSHLVLDQGVVADAIRRFPTFMTYFSTSEQLEIGGMPFVSANMRPTRVESLRYYQAVARVKGLNVQAYARVGSIGSIGGGFRVESDDGRSWEGRSVVVATGYFDTPNPFDVPGADLEKVHRVYTEPYAFAGREVALVGGRNSVVDAALELYRAGAKVTIIHRGPQFSEGVKYWMLPDMLNRINAGEVRALFSTTVARVTKDSLELRGSFTGAIRNDALFVLIGYRPDNRLLESVGVTIVPETLAPVHDEGTMETNVRGVYVAGSIAAGRQNNRIFIENGRLHGPLIVRSILRK